jgi:ketosteroid isomerase-like protein
VVAAAWAQDTGSGRETDHQALRELRAKVTAAINQRDLKDLRACLAKDFVLTLVDQTVITDEAGLKAYYARMFTDKNAPLAKMATVADADILTRFTDPNTGYCYGSGLDTYTLKHGEVVKVKNRWTAVVVKQDGAWKVAAVHVGVNFLDNPVMRARTMSFWRKLGIWLHLAKPPSD